MDTASRIEFASATVVSALCNRLAMMFAKKGHKPDMLTPKDFMTSADDRFEILYPEEVEWGVDTEGRRIRAPEQQSVDQMLAHFLPMMKTPPKAGDNDG